MMAAIQLMASPSTNKAIFTGRPRKKAIAGAEPYTGYWQKATHFTLSTHSRLIQVCFIRIVIRYLTHTVTSTAQPLTAVMAKVAVTTIAVPFTRLHRRPEHGLHPLAAHSNFVPRRCRLASIAAKRLPALRLR